MAPSADYDIKPHDSEEVSSNGLTIAPNSCDESISKEFSCFQAPHRRDDTIPPFSWANDFNEVKTLFAF